MKTIQMTLDEKLIKQVDKTIKKLGTTRSAFTRIALKHELENLNIKNLEIKQIQGYKNKPVKHNEFDVWENEQTWIE
jgi:metal-responsive CopG/Arc/MetJ family transcriptional regulator